MRTTPTKKRNAVLDYILELLQTNTCLAIKSIIDIVQILCQLILLRQKYVLNSDVIGNF